ncbi:cytoplasmic protein [Hymenopellis radicata]|nr:cytoplasmic protein [Hymenopellis radicata]
MEAPQQPLFTCISCAIAFLSAEEQRVHYRSDHHRYNMKRRVASLPPVSATVFNEKVIQRRTETAIMSSLNGSSCEVCNKTYSTENAYRSHIQSKKHKENELRAATKASAVEQPAHEKPTATPAPAPTEPTPSAAEPVSSSVEKTVSENEDEEEDVNLTIDQKIAAARSRISSTQCLFCPQEFSSMEDNLTHMSTGHSFFIPDAEYLVDLPGLIQYLGEKIAVGNVCLYCNGKGREFRTLDAVRKHMLDKGHCKIAYDTEKERLEFSDYYDFTSSYPDAESSDDEEGGSDWEDVDGEGNDDDDVDEVVDAEDVKRPSRKNKKSDALPDNDLTYGDSAFELVLPSGARIGHRSMRRYYAQSFVGLPKRNTEVDPNSGAALVRRLLADKNSALVPTRGGFGAYGNGTEVVKARNRGEAREAGRHVREFRDQRKREAFKTKVGFIHNSQKHYRDPLLQ